MGRRVNRQGQCRRSKGGEQGGLSCPGGYKGGEEGNKVMCICFGYILVGTDFGWYNVIMSVKV
jgi:hypothetical protein